MNIWYDIDPMRASASHSGAQFTGFGSAAEYAEMIVFPGMGSNPMVGATVAVTAAVEEELNS